MDDWRHSIWMIEDIACQSFYIIEQNLNNYSYIIWRSGIMLWSRMQNVFINSLEPEIATIFNVIVYLVTQTFSSLQLRAEKSHCQFTWVQFKLILKTAKLLVQNYFEGYDIQIWPPTSPHLLKNTSNTKIIIFWGVGAEKEQIDCCCRL